MDHSMEMEKEYQAILAQLSEAERRLNRTCDELQVLEEKIQGVQVRLQRCQQRGLAPHSLELQLMTLEGVYSMYYQYGEVKGQELMSLHKRLAALTGEEDLMAG